MHGLRLVVEEEAVKSWRVTQKLTARRRLGPLEDCLMECLWAA